jgi:imidazoleglycerol-phosphate dehydratase
MSNSPGGRTAQVERKTGETKIVMELDLDGTGRFEGETPVPFLSHMLHQVARHGLFDLRVQAAGDTEIDDHHTVEDTGIVLGQAFDAALADRQGLRRYGHASIPFDETLVECSLDLSGRGGLVYNVELPKAKIGTFDVELAREFFGAFAREAGATVHLNLRYGDNLHHIVEASFKALARALDQATREDARVTGIPSSKGSL